MLGVDNEGRIISGIGRGIVVARLTPEQEEEATRQRASWQQDAEEGHQDFPMGDMTEVRFVLNELEKRLGGQGEFEIHPLIDAMTDEGRSVLRQKGYDPDRVGVQTSGLTSQQLLARMPEDVRLGRSPQYAVYQIRLLKFPPDRSPAESLLINCVESEASGDVFMLPEDTISHGNWTALKQWHLDIYPGEYKPGPFPEFRPLPVEPQPVQLR